MTREAMAARLQQIWMPCGEAPCGACDDLQRDLLDWAEGIAQAACAEAVAAERRATLAEIHAATGPTGGWLVAPSALYATIEARTPPPGGGAGEEAR